MKNKYLKIESLSSLVIKYQADKDNYTFSILDTKWFSEFIKYESKLGYFSEVYKPYIIGWVASAKHPETPIKIVAYFGIWTLEQQPVTDIINNSDFVIVYRYFLDEYIELYNPKHDLFVFKSKIDAIKAGYEMQIIDNENIKNQKDMKETNYFMDKFNEVLNNPKVKECYNSFTEAVDEFLNDENTKKLRDDIREVGKDAANITSVLVGDLLKSDIVRELNKQYDKCSDLGRSFINDAVNKSEQFTADLANKVKDTLDKVAKERAEKTDNKPTYSNHTFVKYIRINDENNKIILSKCASKNTAIYNIRINDKKYDISKEQYEDLFLVLTNTEGEKPEYIMNSVKDVLGIPWAKKECKKDKPIQFVQFRKEDEVPQETLFKRKFEIGDSVRVTRGFDDGCKGVIVRIDTHTNENSGKKTLFYIVKFHGGTEVAYKAHYLEKINNVQVEDVGELYRRLDEQAKLITELQSTVNTLQNQKNNNKK